MTVYSAFVAAIITAGMLLAVDAAQAASSRGVPLKLRASEKPDAPVVEEVELYANSHALVIGIDEYTNGWPRLSMAVKDAKLVAEALANKGFDVTLLLNAKSAELNRAFEEFFLLKGEDPDARLFVWYAGHGHSERGEGFLIPADGPTPAKRGQFRLKSLALRRIGEFVRLAESKHAFAIFDSCFSGTVFESARALPPTAVTRATTLPVRQFLTSGDAGQTVSDDGTFRELFLRALSGEERSDANGDGYVTASEMGLFLTDRITNLTQSKQTPRYGKLRDKDWDRGDFVFSLPAAEKPKQVATATRGAATSAAAARLQQETVFWESIKDSGDTGAYKAYLEAYPDGAFVPLAKVKLKAAEGQSAGRQRALADERQALEAERRRLAAEAEARRKAEDEARRKAFAEERAKLAAERERFAAEAKARRKAEEAAQQKRLAAERARLAAERERLAKQQRQLAALTPPATASAPSADPGFLTGDQIKTLFSDNEAQMTALRSGRKMAVEFEADGDLAGSMEGGGTDYGKWWVRENRLCRQWDKWGKNKIRCPHIKLVGKKVEIYRKPGEKIDTWTLQTIPASLRSSTPMTSAPALLPAEYLPLPEGTKVEYDTWSFEVEEIDGKDILYRTNDNIYSKLHAGIVPAGVSPFARQLGQVGGATDAVIELPSEAKSAIASLWPLEVGKTARFEFDEEGFGGSYYSSYEDTWQYDMKVTGAESVEVSGRTLATFVIETKAESKNGRKFAETLWYHPGSGLIVRLKRNWSGRKLPFERGSRISQPNTDPGEEQFYELKRARFPQNARNALAVRSR